MNKKNNLIVLTAVAVGGFLIGCSDFLNKQPNGVEIRENFFLDADQAGRGLIAAYDALGWYKAQETTRWWFGDICSDDAAKGGEGPADFSDLKFFKEFSGLATFDYLGSLWSMYYEAVYRANAVINNVSAIDMDATLKTRYVAEAKFIRGYAYFQLVKIFGEVPLILQELELDDLCHAKNTQDQCWSQIEADFTAAAADLPEKSAYGTDDMGRATKGAANGYLTKVHIFQSEWAEAQAAAEIVINSGEYDLEGNYEDIFTEAHENGIESIFEIQHTTVSNNNWGEPSPSYGDGNEGQVTSIFSSSRASKNIDSTDVNNPDTTDIWFVGWGFGCPTQDLVDAFEENDPRLKATVLAPGDSIWKGTPAYTAFNPGASPTTYHSRKYLLEYRSTKPAMSNAPANWRDLRYADLLLFHAEAANENGDPTTALASLNKVRQRVGLADIAETNKDTLRTLIRKERRVELAMEGHRFYDLVRQGRAAEVLGSAGFVAGKHEYFPIPQSELDACSKLTQNHYYD